MRFAKAILNLMTALIGSWVASATAFEHAPENGVWEGHLGRQTISACFLAPRDTSDDQDVGKAAYFYRRYESAIGLRRDLEHPRRWLEGTPERLAGTWIMGAPGKTSWRGAWKSPDGITKHAISLLRVEDVYGDCVSDFRPGSDGYSPYPGDDFSPLLQAVVAKQAIVATDEKVFMGKSYEPLSAVKGRVESMKLLGGGVGIAAMNGKLGLEFRHELGRYINCATNDERSMMQYSEADTSATFTPEAADVERGYKAKIKPLFSDQEWFSYRRTTDYYCGGAHGDNDTEDLTYHLGESGATWFNVWKWIKGAKPDKYGFFNVAPPALQHRIDHELIARYPQEQKDDPEEHLKTLLNHDADHWLTVALAEDGLLFRINFNHVSKAWEEDILLSYAEAIPYLNAEGKAAVLRILARRHD